MTSNEAKDLIKSWAIYQCGNADARIGPQELSAPMGSQYDHRAAFLGEYQFVQKQIEVFCDKAYDRAMLSAILLSRYYHGKTLKSKIADEFCQDEAERAFIERFEVLCYERPKKVEIA